MFSKPDLKWQVEDPSSFFEMYHQRLIDMTEAIEVEDEMMKENVEMGQVECEYCKKELIHECDEDRKRH